MGRMRDTTPNPLLRDIESELQSRGISQRELCRRTGIRKSSLSRKMRGEVDFKVGELTAITKALDLPPAYFFSDTDGGEAA